MQGTVCGNGSTGGYRGHIGEHVTRAPTSERLLVLKHHSVTHRSARAIVKEKKGGGGAKVTPTETNVHGDALCFMVRAWARHKTREINIQQWWAVGGGWRLAVRGP